MSLMALSVGKEVRSHVSDDGNRWGNRPAACGQLKIRGAALQDRTGRISRCGDEMMRMMLYDAGAFGEMVLAQGLGDADRQAPRDEKGCRRTGAPAGCDHAPHLG